MTTQKKSELLEAKLASLQKDADQFIGHLENELQIAESQRFTDQAQETLRTQIAKARATYDGLLEPVRKDLEAARAEEAEEYKQAMAQIEARAASIPHFALAGNAYRGVGIPFCIRSGETAAERILSSVHPR